MEYFDIGSLGINPHNHSSVLRIQIGDFETMEYSKRLDDGSYKPSTRVIVPGCQGGISQISFGDYDSSQEFKKKPSKSQSQTDKSGIDFGDDEKLNFQSNQKVEQNVKATLQHNGQSNLDQNLQPGQPTNYKPTTRVTQRPGGNSSFTFG
eukprot:NODE_628_length_5237_cov_0.539510.p5 type:complete len:150 gc:universal NODE_628_length_5237_cov_0.539510:1890-2339(+)